MKSDSNNGYYIICDAKRMDLDVIHAFVANSYWAAGIPKRTLKTAVDNSLCFAAFAPDHRQVSFARVVTDSATFAYLSDVFVLEEHRGKGLAKALMRAVISHPRLQGLRRFMLATRDAHGLYAQFDFRALTNPATFMERWQAHPYRNMPVAPPG